MIPGTKVYDQIATRERSSADGEFGMYLIIDLDVNFVRLSVAANQRPEFLEILNSDWLSPKMGQDWRRGR